ncbi:MAG TPA: VWA domain-containing protein, partial [Vicinamibacterales bacterium]|nr:VWA domain-containing protein [Vicinamibacterales bacterium]
DLFHTTPAGSYYAREPLIDFLRRSIGPNDLFGALTPEVPITRLTFARLGETLASDLVRYWPWGEDRKSVTPRSVVEGRLLVCGPTIEAGEALVRGFRNETTANSLDSLVAHLGALRDQRKYVLLVTEGWSMPRGVGVGGLARRQPNVPTVGVGSAGQLTIGNDTSGKSERDWCDTQRNRLAQVDYAQRFLDLMTAAQRANIAFYPLDVAGLRADMPDLSEPGGSMEAMHVMNTQRVDQLMTLANNTDGKAIVSTNDLLGGLRKVVDDLSAYYLLGYQSTNPAADGRWRRIDVKVKQPDVDVSARRGYLAFTAEMVKAEADAARKPVRVRTHVDDALERLGRARADARAYTVAVPSAIGLNVVVELASSEIAGGQWNRGAAVTVTATPKDAGIAPVSIDARIEPGARATLVTLATTQTQERTWQVRTRVTRIGAADEPIDDGVEVAVVVASILSEPMVYRAASSPRAPLQPVADPEFRRTERIHLEWTLTAPLDSRVARLLNKQGDPLPVPVPLTERTDGDRLVLAADLVLAPLAPADYVIEITAARGTDKVQHGVAFRIVR